MSSCVTSFSKCGFALKCNSPQCQNNPLKLVDSPTQGGQGRTAPSPNFWNNKNKCVCNKRTINVCAVVLTVSWVTYQRDTMCPFDLQSSGSNAHVEVEGPWLSPCQLKKPFKPFWLLSPSLVKGRQKSVDPENLGYSRIRHLAKNSSRNKLNYWPHLVEDVPKAFLGPLQHLLGNFPGVLQVSRRDDLSHLVHNLL